MISKVVTVLLVVIAMCCGSVVCWATATSIAEAKNSPNNTTVAIGGVAVSSAFSDFFYIQDQNSLIGMRVQYDGVIPASQAVVSVAGTVQTNSDGELYVQASGVTTQAGTGAISPVAMGCSDVGGAACGYQAGTASVGANNTGMLVSIYGKLTPVSASRILVSDGSGKEVAVIAPPGCVFEEYYAPYPFVVVTGVSSCEKVSGITRPVVRLGSLSDMVELTSPTPAPPVGRIWAGGLTDDGTANLGKLLSDNRFFYGPSVLTGVTYTYPNGAPTNPSDGSPWPGRRLIDGEGSVNWNNPVGVDWAPLVVLFDFKRPCTFTEVVIAPWQNEKNYIKIETANSTIGPWTVAVERPAEQAPGAFLERIPIPGGAAGRFMRITCDQGASTRKLCEVWVWGDAIVSDRYPEVIRPIYSAQAAGYYSIPGINSTSFTTTEFNNWRSQLGAYANQPAVWSQVSTWGTITVGTNISDPRAPILPSEASVKNGRTITIDMARNMTEQIAVALTNTSLSDTVLSVALDDFKLNGSVSPLVVGSLRVMAAMPYSATAGQAYLVPLFSADNMLDDGLMQRYFSNGKYICNFPSVTLTPGGSAALWMTISTKNCAPGVYKANLAASGGSPVTIQVNVHDITLPSPSPTWIHTWGQSTRSQVPFTFSDWTEKQVDHALGLGINVWYGWPTPGSAAAMARTKSQRTLFNIGINYQAADLPAEVNALVAQAQALGLTYDQWYVELWDEPGVSNAAQFGAYCQTIKNTNPNVRIYVDPAPQDGYWQQGYDQLVYDAFSPWYNNLIDISVPYALMVSPTGWPLSWNLWNHQPRFVNAYYHHSVDGISEGDSEVMRTMAWSSFSYGWNGWGVYSLSAAWPYSPYDDPWSILDEAGYVPWLDHMMAYPGPNGAVDSRRAEGIRAGWQEYCLLTLMRQRGLTSQLDSVLASYRAGTSMQTLREQMINYLK